MSATTLAVFTTSVILTIQINPDGRAVVTSPTVMMWEGASLGAGRWQRAAGVSLRRKAEIDDRTSA